MAALQIPPYRSSLLTGADGAPVIRSNGPDSELVMTDRQWYLFWQNAAQQINDGATLLGQLAGLVDYGNHEDRPDPEFATDGTLYVEWNRGSVIYQNQGGTWVYVAGIMYGTLVPDQRPADLDMPDAGFQYRTNVDPAQAFAWSGTAWIETTPIRYGTHAERLAETIADLVSGMLWMETDRGSVIYQNQGGTWLYLAGTMWDTMSPDNRPTDLGIHDAGFDYRSTDPPPREFIWDQTAWVETSSLLDPTTTTGDLIARGATAPATRLPVGTDGQVLTADSTQALGIKWDTPASSAAPFVLFARSTASLALTPTAAAIPGATVTLTTPGRYLITGLFTFNIGDAGVPMRGGLTVGGVDQGTLVILTGTVGAFLAASQQWTYSLGAGTVTANLVASKDSGAGGSVAQGGFTTISALWLGP